MHTTTKRRSTLSMCLSLPLLLSSPLLETGCNENRLDGLTDDDGGNGEWDLSGIRRDLGRNRDAACASVKAEASLTKRPVDIIFIIDNSGSMSDEALAVNNNLNKNFADIIQKSGLDYRVIMVTRHGPYNGLATKAICVTKPLSTLASCSPVPTQPGNNPPIFYHYSRQIESNDSFQRLLNTYNGAEKDDFNLAPMGWSQWLRTDSFKVFVEITDDESGTSETAFETALFAKTPKMFGDAMKRNYVWHSIAGLHENNPATKPWAPADAVQTTVCSGGDAVAPGQVYQRLSKLTGGLRFPICEYASFDAVFNQIALGVIDGAKVACDFPVPMPPPNQKIDPDTIIVEYTPMGTGTPISYKQVPTLAQCMPNAFYIDANRIYLCPAACTTVQQDSKAKLDITFDCLEIIG